MSGKMDNAMNQGHDSRLRVTSPITPFARGYRAADGPGKNLPSPAARATAIYPHPMLQRPGSHRPPVEICVCIHLIVVHQPLHTATIALLIPA